MEEIRVTVVKFGDRKHLQMQYRDPITGKKKTRSTRTTSHRDAERAAAKWEAELREGRYKPPSKVTWEEFRRRYEDEVLPSHAENTDGKVASVFNAVEKFLNPDRLCQITAERISYLQSQLRLRGLSEEPKKGLSEQTIKGHMAHLRAALNWAMRIGLISAVPAIDMPRRAKRSKVTSNHLRRVRADAREGSRRCS